MNEVLLTIMIVGIAAGAIVLGLYMRDKARKKQIKTVINDLPIQIPQNIQYFYDRNGVGPRIQSVVAVPIEAQDAIAEGIQLQIDSINAVHADWHSKKTLNDYDVLLIEPDATNMDGSPALKIRGIQSAGTVIGVGDDGFSPAIIILPHQAATDWRYLTYLRDSARHESEHDREWANNRDVFWSFIGAGDIHPHFPTLVRNTLLLIVMFLWFAFASFGQTVQVEQSFVDDAKKAFDLVVVQRDALEKFKVERAKTDAERVSADALIKGLNDLIAVKEETNKALIRLNKIYEQIIEFQNALIDKLEKRLMKPKSGLQKFLQTLKEVAMVVAGVLIGRGI